MRTGRRDDDLALVVVAHPDPESYCQALAAAAVRGLERKGMRVELLDLYAAGFTPAMSTQERIAYMGDEPIVSEQVRHSAELVKRAHTLVVVYPTWWSGMPAVLKGWFERVLVPGVGFVLDERTNKVRPALRSIRRVIGVTTSGSTRLRMALVGDNGRRLLMRTILLNTNLRARPRWLVLRDIERSSDEQRRKFLVRVERKLAGR